MLLPISAAAKGVLWTILFGLAKTCQYGGLTILGVEGYNRMKNWIRRKKNIMQHVIEKYGFTYCGIIYLASGDERLAYQLIKE